MWSEESYREVFERVEQQAEGQLGFVQQGLCLRDAGESAAKHTAQGTARGEGQKHTSFCSEIDLDRLQVYNLMNISW